MFPEIPARDIPRADTEQMIEVDRAMIVDFHIELIQMMENVGRNLAHLARTRFLDGDPTGKRVLVMAGAGGNGGGALVAARRLSNWGARVHVALGQEPDKMRPVPAHQLDILQRMGVEGTRVSAVTEGLNKSVFNLILDGLIGYSLKGQPRGVIAELITYANASGVSILALDTPSGVDAASGTVYAPAIKAAATMMLALPKTGLSAANVLPQTGELFLADISVPPGLYESAALSMQVGALFARNEILKLV